MKRVILILTLMLVVSVAANQRKFKIAYMLPGNGSTQYTVVEAPDSATAQQIFKVMFQGCKFISYTEIK